MVRSELPFTNLDWTNTWKSCLSSQDGIQDMGLNYSHEWVPTGLSPFSYFSFPFIVQFYIAWLNSFPSSFPLPIGCLYKLVQVPNSQPIALLIQLLSSNIQHSVPFGCWVATAVVKFFMCSTVQKLPKEGNIWANNEKCILRSLRLCICDTLPPFFLIEQEISAELVRKQNFHSMGNSNTWEKSEGAEVFMEWKFRENIFGMMEVFHKCQIILTPESPKVIMTLKY